MQSLEQQEQQKNNNNWAILKTALTALLAVTWKYSIVRLPVIRNSSVDTDFDAVDQMDAKTFQWIL